MVRMAIGNKAMSAFRRLLARAEFGSGSTRREAGHLVKTAEVPQIPDEIGSRWELHHQASEPAFYLLIGSRVGGLKEVLFHGIS